MALRKLCLIAGVGPGLGLAIARRFARAGYDLALIARSGAVIEAYADELRGEGVAARAFPADLSDAAALRSALATIRGEMGDAELLVYNASRWRPVPAMELDQADFNADLALDVTGALVCAQALYPAMRAAGRGVMLFTGSRVAIAPQDGKGVVSLTAGKAALRAFAHALAGEIAPEGIHVATITVDGTIAPGTAFDPAVIAEHFTRIAAEPPGHWTVEHVFRP